jgi:hypothetical protein
VKLSNIMVKNTRVVMAVAIAAGVVGTPNAFAKSADRAPPVQPVSVPMFLQAGDDGHTFLYVQRKQGVELAALDVTDIAKAQTGSTFLLTDDGVYVVRRPDDEWIKRFRDQAYEN